MASALLESLLGEQDIASAAPALVDARRTAAAALRRDGLPGPRDEAWKYTSLRALEQRRYVDGDVGAASRAIDPASYALAGVDGPRYVFVNGVFRADLSDLAPRAGLEIIRFVEQPERFVRALSEGSAAGAFAQLNAALATDGLLLRVAADVRVDDPVHLVFVGAPADVEIAWQLRVQIELGDGARLRVIEHHVAAGAHAHLGNLVADYALAANARLDLVQVQDAAETSTLIRRSEARLGQDSVLRTHTIEVGAQLMRHDLVVALAGHGARFDSRGVFALRGRQHADTHLTITHTARDTSCDIAWRGVADQRARGVFHGAITVAEGADGADAQLSNKNLLLSAQAEIDTQPVLEIYADEVKAAHGATVGQLDEQALFYLRTRGIPLDLARRVLVSAFCGAVLAELAPELRAPVDALLAARLPQAEAA
jgi:Fe-S cluster assembly protein SufD